MQTLQFGDGGRVRSGKLTLSKYQMQPSPCRIKEIEGNHRTLRLRGVRGCLRRLEGDNRERFLPGVVRWRGRREENR